MGCEFNPPPAARQTSIPEAPECFICRDYEFHAGDPLRNFCDCRTLLAHHLCLSTWIQKGGGSDDRLRCAACRGEYQLRWRSPWRWVMSQWQTWLVLLASCVMLGLVSYLVHYLMTGLTSPPPPTMFKVAAAAFGLLTEILLVKCVFSFLSSQYQQAERSSFVIQPRGSEAGRVDPRDRASPSSSEGGRRAEVAKDGCLIVL